MAAPIRVAVSGQPNCGKSTMFNAITGGSARVGNYPGITVDRLEGSYQELTAYLERLEAAKPKLLWSSVSLSAEDHPRLVLTLTVYSLSLERAWLIV